VQRAGKDNPIGATRDRITARRPKAGEPGQGRRGPVLVECVFYALRGGHVRRLQVPAPERPTVTVA
jgi:hypothetical protein